MLHRERDRANRIIELGKRLPIDDDELVGHWGRYACVSCAGYLETAFRLVIQKRIENKSSPEIQAFVVRSLESIQNPKAERFVKVLRSFRDEWGSSLEEFFQKNDEVKNAIDSIMANRHLIAHGKNCSISLGRIQAYFKLADMAISFIDEMLNTENDYNNKGRTTVTNPPTPLCRD